MSELVVPADEMHFKRWYSDNSGVEDAVALVATKTGEYEIRIERHGDYVTFPADDLPYLEAVVAKLRKEFEMERVDG